MPTKVDASNLFNNSNTNETLLNTTTNNTKQQNDDFQSASLSSSRLDSPRSLPIQFYSSSFELSDLPLDFSHQQEQDHLDAFFLSRKNSIKLKRSLLNKHRPLSYVEMSSSNATTTTTSSGVAPPNFVANDKNECKKNLKLAPRLTQMHPHHHNNFSQHNNLLQVNNHRQQQQQQHNHHHHHANTSPHLSILDIKHFSSNLSMSGGLDADNDQLSSLFSSSSSSCSSNSNENNHLVTTDDVILMSGEDVISKFVFETFARPRRFFVNLIQCRFS